MIDVSYLEKLLPLLKAHGCYRFVSNGLELSLSSDKSDEVPKQNPTLQEIKVDESNLPPDLRADDLFNADKVLHWSSGGVEGEMPLTGEGATL